MTMLENVTGFFINNANAAPVAGAAPQSANNFSLILMVGVFFAFIYFTVWRPQSKRAKEQRSLMSSLTKGDEVVSAGGILGVISKLNDNYITINIADNVDMAVQKSSIVNVLPKGTLKSI
jgi:preprotein translocase subunit YajC